MALENPRARKLIGLAGVLVFLAGYILLVTKVSDHIPNNIIVQTLFYVVAGLGWGVPIIPLLRWMNTGR